MPRLEVIKEASMDLQPSSLKQKLSSMYTTKSRSNCFGTFYLFENYKIGSMQMFADKDGVVSIFPSKLLQLQTTRIQT